VGFNPMQPGKVKPGELAMIAAVLIWALH